MATTDTTPIALRCERLRDPLAIDRPRPRLSWRQQSAARGARQSAWQIQAAGEAAGLEAGGAGLLWDSGRREGHDNIDLPWGGPDLASFTRVWWRVRIWDGDANVGPWSALATFAVGLLAPEPWPAVWIGSALNFTPAVPLLRRSFTTTRPVVDARLFATARGVCDLRIDGSAVGDDTLTPGFHDFRKRQLYRAWDVTERLRSPGEHVLGATLGDGWYKGPVAWGPPKTYGGETWLLALLRLVHDDGSVTLICTDGEWRCRQGPTLQSGLLIGETHDATQEPGGWDQPGHAVSTWLPVRTRGLDQAIPLQAHPGQPIREVATFAPKRTWMPRPGIEMVDFGQNHAGRLRLTLDGVAPGTVLRLRHGEMATPSGELYTDNLRGALASDTYICRGGRETWEPRFTFHGYQFAEISGLGRPLRADEVSAVALASDCPVAGHFACSDPRLNQLYSNIIWTQRANWLDVPTDCPQRDERMGWTGDAQAYIRTATFTHDVQAFFAKWLTDLADAQDADGAFPNYAPDPGGLIGGPAGKGDAGWGDAGVICPWALYQAYGDRDALRALFPGMRKWVAYLGRTGLGDSDLRWALKGRLFTFADWLNVDDNTGHEVIMTAFYAHAVALTAAAAEVLGEVAAEKELRELHQRIVAAFRRDLVRDGWRVWSRSLDRESQTGYVLALHFDLLEPQHRATAAARLVELIAARDHHLSTGFLGLAYLMPVLTRFGHAEIALRLLVTDTYPSWLYEVAQGATTIWERWNGWKKDVGPADPGMNSYAHYAYGAVGEWLFTDLAGIDQFEPAFHRIHIRPRPGAGLSWVEAWHDCPYGRIASRWQIDGGTLTLDITIPANTSAVVEVPTTNASSVRCDGAAITTRPGSEPGYVALDVAAGRWRLTATR
ncbi:alpha-L-rhamnosidase [Planctomycetota bacterium]|nr:alpha-L-rhamnosidase [Planctomycetota bacterium]